RDGISQPHFFADESSDVLDRRNANEILEADRITGEEGAYGSYVVYRKLEQNVKAFRAAEEKLVKELQLAEWDRPRAGAMLIGRFQDGSPLTKYDRPMNKADNGFDFSDDAAGSKCPIHAHIRKVRARSGSWPRMVRRGVPYGDYHPRTDATPPEKDCGLLFLSFQQNIFRQFGLVQHEWANADDFPNLNPLTGPDPVIAQRIGHIQEQLWPESWGKPAMQKISLGGYVTLKGGEFLFAPSLTFFAQLQGRQETS